MTDTTRRDVEAALEFVDDNLATIPEGSDEDMWLVPDDAAISARAEEVKRTIRAYITTLESRLAAQDEVVEAYEALHRVPHIVQRVDGYEEPYRQAHTRMDAARAALARLDQREGEQS